MTSPRILVSGYYGFANAGDEAILAGLVAGFQELAPEARLTVLSGDPQATEGEHGVSAARRGLLSARRLLRRSDLLISGGGGLLQDVTSWRSPLYYLAVVRLAASAGVPVACLGQSVGPLRRPWVRRLVKKTLARVAVMAARDRASAEALRALGLNRPVHLTGDLAFLLPAPAEEAARAAWAKAGLPQAARPAVGVALRAPLGSSPNALARLLAAALTEGCAAVGCTPVLVPMHHPRDLAFADAVAGELPGALVARPQLGARELLALLGGCELVVGMRLHALVFAAIGGRPPVAISYDPKVDGLMAQLGLPVATAVSSFDPRALSDAIRETWAERAAIGDRLVAILPALRAGARRNLELTLPLLEGR